MNFFIERRKLTIVVSPQDLGSDVVWSATEGGRGVSRPQTLLTHAIVREFDMAIHIQQHVVQF